MANGVQAAQDKTKKQLHSLPRARATQLLLPIGSQPQAELSDEQVAELAMLIWM